MTIKPLSADDIDIITALYQKDFADGWNAKMLLSAFNGGRFVCFGAFESEVLTGVIACSVAMDEADIESVVTRLEYRRRGVGGKLIDYALTHLKDLGTVKVFLEVRESNSAAIGLYKKHGFDSVSVRKKYYADGENALVMTREI